jgi:tetratricopeptide (TPR) repeat protein
MRVIALVAVLCLASPGFAQTRDEHWKRCADSSVEPDLGIGACTALIQSGSETTTNLSIAYNNRGADYKDKGEYARAIQDFDQAIRLDPAYAQAYASRCDAHARNGDAARGIKDCDHALGPLKATGTARTNALYGRGNAYYILDQYDRAIQDFDAVLKLQPDDTANWSARGNAYLMKADYDRAIQDYTQSLKLDATRPAVHGGRGRAHAAKGEHALAVRSFDDAIKYGATADFHKRRGDSLRQLRDFDRAIDDYTRAIALDPAFADAYNGRGLAYRNKNDDARAIASYDEAIRLSPKTAAFWNNRGVAYYYRADFDRAIQNYDEALKLNPKYALTLANRGATTVRKGDAARAIADLDASIAIEPKLAPAWFIRAIARLRIGDTAGSNADAAAARQLQTDIDKVMADRGLTLTPLASPGCPGAASHLRVPGGCGRDDGWNRTAPAGNVDPRTEEDPSRRADQTGGFESVRPRHHRPDRGH